MSDFRIIKCSKCDAPLVEYENEKLSKCVQCGYSFGIKNQKLESKLKSYTPEVTSIVRKLKKSESKNSAKTESAKKKSVMSTLVKWYFALVFFFWLLSKIL